MATFGRLLRWSVIQVAAPFCGHWESSISDWAKNSLAGKCWCTVLEKLQRVVFGAQIEVGMSQKRECLLDWGHRKRYSWLICWMLYWLSRSSFWVDEDAVEVLNDQSNWLYTLKGASLCWTCCPWPYCIWNTNTELKPVPHFLFVIALASIFKYYLVNEKSITIPVAQCPY